MPSSKAKRIEASVAESDRYLAAVFYLIAVILAGLAATPVLCKAALNPQSFHQAHQVLAIVTIPVGACLLWIRSSLCKDQRGRITAVASSSLMFAGLIVGSLANCCGLDVAAGNTLEADQGVLRCLSICLCVIGCLGFATGFRPWLSKCHLVRDRRANVSR